MPLQRRTVFLAAANASQSDAIAYAHATMLEAAQISRLAGGLRVFDCQLASLKAHQLADRTPVRKHELLRSQQQTPPREIM